MNTNKWTSEQWRVHDAALLRLLRPQTDALVRDLDTCGWKIVAQGGGTEKFPMNAAGPCPPWASAYIAPKEVVPQPPGRQGQGGRTRGLAATKSR
jgi:hypothetical protein